jgi:hypothetical protein
MSLSQACSEGESFENIRLFDSMRQRNYRVDRGGSLD